MAGNLTLCDVFCVVLQACERSGITFLSIAHRPALKRFHHVIIHFVSPADAA